jgi:hypothetical protein
MTSGSGAVAVLSLRLPNLVSPLFESFEKGVHDAERPGEGGLAAGDVQQVNALLPLGVNKAGIPAPLAWLGVGQGVSRPSHDGMWRPKGISYGDGLGLALLLVERADLRIEESIVCFSLRLSRGEHNLLQLLVVAPWQRCAFHRAASGFLRPVAIRRPGDAEPLTGFCESNVRKAELLAKVPRRRLPHEFIEFLPRDFNRIHRLLGHRRKLDHQSTLGKGPRNPTATNSRE